MTYHAWLTIDDRTVGLMPDDLGLTSTLSADQSVWVVLITRLENPDVAVGFFGTLSEAALSMSGTLIGDIIEHDALDAEVFRIRTTDADDLPGSDLPHFEAVIVETEAANV
jgi:hypothetical protein